MNKSNSVKKISSDTKLPALYEILIVFCFIVHILCFRNERIGSCCFCAKCRIEFSTFWTICFATFWWMFQKICKFCKKFCFHLIIRWISGSYHFLFPLFLPFPAWLFCDFGVKFIRRFFCGVFWIFSRKLMSREIIIEFCSECIVFIV